MSALFRSFPPRQHLPTPGRSRLHDGSNPTPRKSSTELSPILPNSRQGLPSSGSLAGQGEERQLAMAPSQLKAFIHAVRQRFDEASANGSSPVFLTSPLVRPYVRSIIERFRPLTPVISQNEIHPSVRLRTMGQI